MPPAEINPSTNELSVAGTIFFPAAVMVNSGMLQRQSSIARFRMLPEPILKETLCDKIKKSEISRLKPH
jgi:hypothetical protein